MSAELACICDQLECDVSEAAGANCAAAVREGRRVLSTTGGPGSDARGFGQGAPFRLAVDAGKRCAGTGEVTVEVVDEVPTRSRQGPPKLVFSALSTRWGLSSILSERPALLGLATRNFGGLHHRRSESSPQSSAGGGSTAPSFSMRSTERRADPSGWQERAARGDLSGSSPVRSWLLGSAFP